MAAIRHLTRAPISEALIDIRVVVDSGFDGKQLLAAKERLRDRYPIVHEQQTMVATIDLATVGSAPKVDDRGFHGIHFKTSDEKSVAQFRVDGFTYNRLNPYTSWELLLAEARSLWEVYRDIVRPKSVSRVGVRYLNHIHLPSERRELKESILTGPVLPAQITQELVGFATRTNVVDESRNVAATITQILEPPVKSNQPTLFLDIDTYRASEMAPEWEVLEPVLSALRKYKNEIFFGSLTDTLVETFA